MSTPPRPSHLLKLLAVAGALAFALSNSAAVAQQADPIGELQRASPQPSAEALEPGLAVEYISVFVRHVDQAEASGKGRPGQPLEMLDWNTLDGEVLTSGEDDGVAARITGFIRFAEAGTYMLTMQSNDGIRLLIGGKKIIEDPDVHRDRFSPIVPLQISTPGWYPLYLIYFERKGTSTLEMYWQPPGAEDFDFVPAEAFARPKAG